MGKSLSGFRRTLKVCVGLTWCALRAPNSHAAAVLGDTVVCDLGDDLRVGLQVEQEDVVGLQVSIDNHGGVKVPDHMDHTVTEWESFSKVSMFNLFFFPSRAGDHSIIRPHFLWAQ